MIAVRILVDEKLTPTRYLRLEEYIRSEVGENENIEFRRNHIIKKQTYLRVAVRRNVYDQLVTAINNAPNVASEILWKEVDLHCYLEEIDKNIYFNAAINSLVNNPKIVKRTILAQNPHINIDLWVFVTSEYFSENRYPHRLIFSVPLSDLGVSVTYLAKTFNLNKYKQRQTNITQRFDDSSSTIQPRKRPNEEILEELSDGKKINPIQLREYAQTTHTHTKRLGSNLTTNLPSTSTAETRSRKPNDEEGLQNEKLSFRNTISKILQRNSDVTLTEILKEFKNRFGD